MINATVTVASLVPFCLLCNNSTSWSWTSCSSDGGIFQESTLWLYNRKSKIEYKTVIRRALSLKAFWNFCDYFTKLK